MPRPGARLTIKELNDGIDIFFDLRFSHIKYYFRQRQDFKRHLVVIYFFIEFITV